MRFPGTKWCMETVGSPQMVRDQKKFGKHWYTAYIYRTKLRLLEVRENEIALRKLSGGIAHLTGNTGSAVLVQ